MAKSTSYADIQRQIQSLQAEANVLRRKEVDGVIARIKEAIATYSLTAADLGLGRTPRAAKKTKPAKTSTPQRARKGKVAIKYRDDSGNTWTGRGLKPRWLQAAIAAGKKLEDFAV